MAARPGGFASGEESGAPTLTRAYTPPTARSDDETLISRFSGLESYGSGDPLSNPVSGDRAQIAFELAASEAVAL